MGKPDLFAKRTMAEQAESLTRGGATWKDAPEIGFEKVQSDGILVVHDLERLHALPPPWSLVFLADEILIEFKMEGDHLDLGQAARVLMRRQAREVQRIEESLRGQTPWEGDQTLWLVSGYVPKWAQERYRPIQLAPGCYEWMNGPFTALWIAANELPLREELIPFLIARTGRRRNEFVSWVLFRQKLLRWVEMMVESGVMLRGYSEEDVRATLEQIRQADEEGRKNLEEGVLFFLKVLPGLREKLMKQLTREVARQNLKKGVEKGIAQGVEKGIERGIERGIEKGLAQGVREALVTVLHARNLEVRPEHLARIDACNDVASLRQWLARAACATSTDEALS